MIVHVGRRAVADFDRSLDERPLALLSMPSRKINGLFWWGLAVMKSPIRSRGMFDEDGNALAVLRIFDPYKHGVAE